MPEKDHYDIIIAGGGAAGLSLAYHLILSPLRSLCILIIDKDDDDQLNRNWGYWTEQTTLFDAVPHHSWQQLDFLSPTYSHRYKLGNYEYHLMHGKDFYLYVLAQLAENPRVTFHRSVIRTIESSSDTAKVITYDGEFTATWVFDSILRFSELKSSSSGHHLLRMQFKGLEIVTPDDAFDTRAAQLFDLRTPQHNELRFFYLMPYSKNRAFIEFTVFAKGVIKQDEYELALKEYIESVLGIENYQVKSEENGVVPLTDHEFPRRVGAHVMSIGAKAGRVKPSTGYSFMRVQLDTERIVASLVRHGHPFDIPHDMKFFWLCDALLLDVMQYHGERVGFIFTSLFKHNPIQHVLRFLDERTSPIETAALIATLPPWLFIEALVRKLFTRRS